MAGVSALQESASVTLDMVEQTVTRILMCAVTRSHVFMELPAAMMDLTSTLAPVWLVTLVTTAKLRSMSAVHCLV